jgi:hypothetical protein
VVVLVERGDEFGNAGSGGVHGREFRDDGRGAKGEVQGATGEFSFSFCLCY